ncbi:hypothetical protein B0T10DRAFT_543083 [Thelonectria olida]|uniref:Zn(2)-C6 fungal-type domain-containing protein n=1 Tax=Thelonectria olida TaxID=1576542 RepID=A0A9P9AS85_9HYPO|nr:hypothetical protein B0T10DRAFT_543083 [Thelonectria olida]
MDGQPDLMPQPTPGSRRKMRKGTHSCIECRRRKIRCKFQTGNTSQCLPCTARGSPCVDQRDVLVNRQNQDNLRERVSRIESILQNQPKLDLQEPGFNFQHLKIVPQQDHTGGLDEPREADKRAPFVSMLNEAEGNLQGAADEEPATHPPQGSPFRQHRTPHAERSSQICTTLRSALPDYGVLMSTLSTNGGWWSSFRHKTHAICQGPLEGLAAFAAHAYTSEAPAELGMLVTAYARSSSENYHLFPLVENLIASDSTLSLTDDGMDCLLLLAKAYSDIGQPRQAWLIYRKGVAIAEMMGLYRRETKSLRHKSIWWAFYHGDRFTSLLLGLPYGFNDAHFGPSIESFDEGPVVAEQRFILRCAFIAGKVIDRNVMPGNPSSASSMLLDEQMDVIASSMPECWWALPDELCNSDAEIDMLRDRLLQQYYFFHVRLNLHLPFIARSATTFSRASHRPAGMEASRQLLRRFVLLRTRIRGESIFDCKTSDFVGFMAAVALILGLSHLRSDTSSVTLTAFDEDQRLITLVKGIFQREEKENECRIASQCRRTLDMLLGKPINDNRSTTGLLEQKIVIPYFGSVSRSSAQKPEAQSPPSGQSIPVSMPIGLTSASSCEIPNDAMGTPSIELGSDSMSEYMGTSAYWQFDGLEDFPMDDLSTWLDMSMVDVNQDWADLLDNGSGDYSSL